MPRFIPTILFAAQFLFFAYGTSAQSLPLSSSCPCTLQGSVVDSVSGQPVPHALVRLAAPSPRAALTDSEGKFQFENLPAGLVTLEAEKPGYLSRDSIGPNLSLPASVQLAPDSPPVTLKLTPESIIFGQVTDERGEPLEGFTLSIWSHIFNTNLSEVGMGSPFSAHTDDQGKFRIAKLSPGSYILLVNPPEGGAQKLLAKSSVPSGYAPFIYSGANDLFSASAVRLLPGKSQQVNFSLKREPFVRLSGTVSGYNPGDQVTLTLWAAAGVQDPHIVFDPANGSFRTDWIPPGPYTLIAQATSTASPEASALASQSGLVLQFVQARESSPHSFASQQINAGSSISDMRMVLQPTVNVPLIVHGFPSNHSDERPNLLPRFFALVPKSPGASSPEYFPGWENPEDTHFSGDLRMVFSGIPPGTYELVIGPLSNASVYVESASSGSTNLLRENLPLSGSIPPIDVVFRDDPAILSGFIYSGGTPAPGVVVLLSDSRSKPTMLSTFDRTGAFRIAGLAPGSYRVFATVPAVNPDYLDPAFQQKISSKIQEITLSPKQSASLNLELATVEE